MLRFRVECLVSMTLPPGTGKTLIARACAAQTNATYLKLAGPLLVQMFIGDGAKLVRDAFALAKVGRCRFTPY
jgi:ATP-dependent 26S proteasome regulatory subunit